MQQPCAEFLRLRGQDRRSLCIEHAGQRRFPFGLVHRGMGSGIHDHIGRYTAHGVGQTLEVAEVATQAVRVGGRVEVQRHQITQHRQAALQFPPHLATSAQQENFHAVAGAPYCRAIQSR